MNNLLNFFIDLCLLRATPQELPASRLLLGLTLLVNLVVSLLLVAGARLGPLLALTESLFEIGLQLSVLLLVLTQQRRRQRFLQTATAVLGSGVFMGLLALPLLSLSNSDGELAELGALMLVGAMAWSVLVLGHILRHALELPLTHGVLAAMLYTITSWVMVDLLFPVG